jgi:hypothetical protein
MMSRVFGSAAFLSAVIAAALLFANTARADEPPVTLVDPQWQQQTDSQGTVWMLNPQPLLMINSGQSLLMQVGILNVNGNQFSPQRTQMTPDGHEYVFEGPGAANGGMPMGPYAAPTYGYAPGMVAPGGMGVATTRRIKLDLATSTVRFVESFQNTTAAQVQVSVATNNMMRTMIRSALSGPSGTTLDTSSGQPMAVPAGGVVGPGGVVRRGGVRIVSGNVRLAVPERDSAVAFSDGNNNFADAFFFLPSSATAKPAIDVQNMRTVVVTYSVTVPANSTVSVIWGLSQRNAAGAFSTQELKDRLKTFEDRKWLAGLPDSVVKTIVNYRRDVPTGSLAGLLMQPVVNLAWQNHVERGKADILVQDAQSRMQGAAAGSGLTVETSWGKVSLPLAEVALLFGGDASDRPMRVYLRDGEVLSGRVEAKDLALKAQDGVVAKLPPEKINMLFFHAAENDGGVPPDAVAIIQAGDGQRLLIGGDARLRAISPWGGLDIGLAEIVNLGIHREPQPLYRIALRDGSNLSVLLQDDAADVKTLRFGPLKIAGLDLRQLWSLKLPQPKTTGPADASGPLCQLIGDNVLAATLDAPQLKLETPGGTVGVPVKDIQKAERTGDPRAGGPFNVELTNGQHVTGTLTERTISVRFHDKVWEVPGGHLMGITAPPKPPPPTPKPAAAKDGGDKAEAVAVPARGKTGPAPVKPAPPARPVLSPPANAQRAAPATTPAPPPPVAKPVPPPTESDDPFGADFPTPEMQDDEADAAPVFTPAMPADLGDMDEVVMEGPICEPSIIEDEPEAPLPMLPDPVPNDN